MSRDLAALLAQAEAIAAEHYDGHLTILRFTTCWKAAFGTVDLDGDGRRQVSMMEPFETLEGALSRLIANPLSLGLAQ